MPDNTQGRPSLYTQELADDICAQLSQGKSLASICSGEGMPHPATVYRWLRAHESFRDNYTRAKEDQADYLVDQLLAVADDDKLDANDKRIRVDARKWIASKFKPKKYGDRVDIGNADGGFRVILGDPIASGKEDGQ